VKQASPPPGRMRWYEESLRERPSRREWEPLLFEVPGISKTQVFGDSQMLFDNRIAPNKTLQRFKKFCDN
jgi:hypothetical protein